MKKIFIFNLLIFAFINSQASINLASTTSTQNSGLYEYLTPILEKKIKDNINVIAVGTGQALKIAENGDADILIVHAPKKEKEFVKSGYGIDRKPFMYNKFIIVGPKSDPANIKESKTAIDAFIRIKQAGKNGKVKFISRGDNSGTYFKEQSLWNKIKCKHDGKWYLETGSGMGATLNIAVASNAYTLSDSSTWLKFNNKQNFNILFSDDKVLFNQYSIILIPKSRYTHVKFKKSKMISDWLVSEEGQKAINSYKIKDKQAFFANYTTNNHN